MGDQIELLWYLKHGNKITDQMIELPLSWYSLNMKRALKGWNEKVSQSILNRINRFKRR